MIRPLLGLLTATFLVPWASPGLAYTGGETRTMLASWYGHPFHGRTAANGETYDMHRLTAAHKTLAFGTRLRVCLEGCVEVRIIDRGPFIAGRDLDLSFAAAQRIGLIEPGVDDVQVTFL